MELKKVVGGGAVTHIAEARFKEFNGVNLTKDTVQKEVEKRDPESIRKSMMRGYMQLINK